MSVGNENYTHVWFWRKWLPDRKGQRCRVVGRGAMGSIMVEFEDGKKVVTSRWAVRNLDERRT